MSLTSLFAMGRKLSLVSAAFAVAGVSLTLVASPAHAFPALNLMPGTPDISSPAQIDVSYSFNAGTGIGSLTAFGGASLLNLPPGQGISIGLFDLNATIDTNTTTASGSLVINGTSGPFVDPLLTGTLNTFGAGPNDPLEFLFGSLGGSVAANFGSTAGVILSNTGFTGSLTTNFGTGGSFGASADTFARQAVPEPGTLALMLLGSGVLAATRRRKRKTTGA